MDIQPLRDLTLQQNLMIHGVPATVTVPGRGPVVTRLIWVRQTVEVPTTSGAVVAEARRVAVLSRADVPAVPRLTTIVAPEKPGAIEKTWRVDGFEQTHEPDLHRVLVVPAS